MDAHAEDRFDVVVCGACGEPLDARDRFCEGCGEPRSPRRPVPASLVVHEPRDPPRHCVDCGAAGVDDGFCETCGLRQPGGRERVEIELAAPVTGPARGPARAAGVSDVGLRRDRNEDALAMASLPGTVCAVVCDGVASAPGSERAAITAAETGARVLTRRIAVGSDPPTALRAAVRCAADAVRGLAADASRGAAGDASPACTFVAAVATADSVTVAWVGDSRAYWLRCNDDRLLTRDDTWAVRMVARGTLTPEEAWADPRAHLLTAWLGADADVVEPHVATFTPAAPGVLLVCSDGLWGHLPEPADLAAVLDTVPDPAGAPLAAARALVRAALDAGGHDNVTVALVPYPRDPEPAEPTRET
ncbi:protein phosphatase 2C domain-containing protein, partial [Actinomadura kijaniata]|uniref:protein phosphatase 2C domain-containing protein n=1 Tax=Actinomadura kijaniata TaxID=46161 RepID=UPI003F1C480D